MENTSFCIVIVFFAQHKDIICKKSNTFPRSRNIFLYLTKHHFQYVTGCKLTKNSNRRGYSTERLNNCLKSEIHGIHKPPKIKSGAKVIVGNEKVKSARESIYAKKEINELQDSPQLRIHFVYIAFLYVLFFFFRFSFDQVVVVVGLFFCCHS